MKYFLFLSSPTFAVDETIVVRVRVPHHAVQIFLAHPSFHHLPQLLGRQKTVIIFVKSPEVKMKRRYEEDWRMEMSLLECLHQTVHVDVSLLVFLHHQEKFIEFYSVVQFILTDRSHHF